MSDFYVFIRATVRRIAFFVAKSHRFKKVPKWGDLVHKAMRLSGVYADC
jgi:hypothetical protein